MFSLMILNLQVNKVIRFGERGLFQAIKVIRFNVCRHDIWRYLLERFPAMKEIRFDYAIMMSDSSYEVHGR